VDAIDLSPEMIAVASRQAAALRIENVRFQVMDAEALHFDEGTFAALTNAYGLMFCPNPAQALAEAHHVLVSGGRIGVAVWDEPSKSPFLTLIRDVGAEFLGLPEPAADDPHPFRLASAAVLASLLTAARFSDVTVESVPMTFECESADDYCRLFADLSIKSRIAARSSADVARFQGAVARALQPHTVDGRVRLVGTSLFASGTKSG
jgi:SAM-dependent methyltransferase